MAIGERKTRKKLIDKALEESAWSPVVRSRNDLLISTGAVEEYLTENGPADYILFHRGEALAIVEAKKLSKGPESAIEQAKRYSKGYKEGRFDFRGFRIPFVYSSNGEVIYFQDLRDRFNLPREVSRFHTPSGLRSLLITDSSKAYSWFKTTPTTEYGLRDYQREAVDRIEEALTNGKSQQSQNIKDNT